MDPGRKFLEQFFFQALSSIKQLFFSCAKGGYLVVLIRLTVGHKTAKKFSLKAKKIDKFSPLVVKKFTEIFFLVTTMERHQPLAVNWPKSNP